MRKCFTIICMLLMMFSCNVQAQNRKPAVRKSAPTATARKPKAANATPRKKSVTKLCPNDNHPHAIDLGLPSGTKWACCNVGAAIPEEYGDYFAQGEIRPKKSYMLENYKYHDGSNSYESGFYHAGMRDIRGKEEYDAAKAVMGKKWIMPSGELYNELFGNCIHEWVEFNGVFGMLLTGPNGNAIFLPAGGSYSGDKITGLNNRGVYWPGTSPNCSLYAGYYTSIDISNYGCKVDDCIARRTFGYTIRAIADF